MKNHTRELFNELKADTATANGVTDVTEKFNITPTVQQRLVDQMGESAEFLQKINLIGVDEQKGEKLGLGVGLPLAGRTNTNQSERQTAYVGSMTKDGYECIQTNSDTHLDYRVMDAWAKFQDFKKRYRKAVVQRIPLDRMLVGTAQVQHPKPTAQRTRCCKT